MPIPYGSHQVPGEPNRIELADGTRTTRASALTMGAQELGFSSHRQYRNYLGSGGNDRDTKYFNAWKRGNQGQRIVDIEKERAKQAGHKYSPSAMKQRLIAARNGRPHPKADNPGNESFHSFLRDYEVSGQEDIIRY